MEDKEIKRIRKAIGRFPVILLKKAIHVLGLLELHHITVEDVNKYIQVINKMMSAKKEPPFNKACPECKEPLMIYNIAIPKGRSNIYGYKSRWFCKICLWEQYETDTIYEIIERYKREHTDIGN